MKKKFALLMAALMTATMVPVTAFAATSLTAVDEISTAVDSTFESRVELVRSNEQVEIDGDTFAVTLKLTNGTFAYIDDDDDNDYVMQGYEDIDNGIYGVDVVNSTTATVTLVSSVFNEDEDAWKTFYAADQGVLEADVPSMPDACVLTITAQATDEGDVTAKFSSNVSGFKTASEVIATAYDGDVEVEVDGVKTFVEDADDGEKELKDITIDELVSGALTGKDITLKLKGNYEYTCDDSDVEVSFLNQTISYDVDVDDDTITISFSSLPSSSTLKYMTISGITIEPTSKCDAGDTATITISSGDFSSVKLEVGKMVEEAVTYSVEDDDLPVIWSGANNDEINTLEVSVEENTGDILNTSRKATFTFPEGVEVVDINSVDGISVDGVDDDFNYEIDENVVSIWNYASGSSEDDETDMTISFVLNAAPTYTGDIDVTLGGQFDDVTFTVATAKAPYTVEGSTSEVLIDYRYVPVNDIIITEAEDGILDDGDVITLAVEKMDFEDSGELEITEGDIDADVDIISGDDYDLLQITINDASTEASTMTISGLELYLDRTLPVGGYELQNVYDEDGDTDNILWENVAEDDETDGSVLGYDENGIFKYEALTINDEYVSVITSARDQDDSTTTKKVVITVGALTMTSGTETITLDAPAYINAESYTMLPLRAISETFGATVNWDDASKTITILSGQRIISMTIGSETMYINGTPVAMNTSPEITSERTFVPVRDLANALGISDINWEEASGVVTLN